MAIDGSKLMSFKILCFNVDFTKIVIYTRVTRKTHAKQIEKNTYKNNQENRYTFVFACYFLYIVFSTPKFMNIVTL